MKKIIIIFIIILLHCISFGYSVYTRNDFYISDIFNKCEFSLESGECKESICGDPESPVTYSYSIDIKDQEKSLFTVNFYKNNNCGNRPTLVGDFYCSPNRVQKFSEVSKFDLEITCVDSPSCIGYGKPVSSWYIYQTTADGNHFYWDNSLKQIEEYGNIKLFTKLSLNPSALLNTYNLLKSKILSHVVYNDNSEYKNIEGGGIHVIHTLPNFPQFKDVNNRVNYLEDPFVRTNKEGKKSDIKFSQAQTAYCYTMDPLNYKNDMYHFLTRINAGIVTVNFLKIGYSLAKYGSYFEYKFHDFKVFDQRVKDMYSSTVDLNYHPRKYMEFRKNYIDWYNTPHTEFERKLKLNEVQSTESVFPLVELSYHAFFLVHCNTKENLPRFGNIKTNQQNYFFQNDYLFHQAGIPTGSYLMNSISKLTRLSNSHTNKDTIFRDILLWDYVYENLNGLKKEDYYLQTQHYDDIEKGQIPINDYLFKLVDTIKIKNQDIIRYFDHSKQLYSQNIFCVGDTNYVNKQSIVTSIGDYHYCFAPILDEPKRVATATNRDIYQHLCTPKLSITISEKSNIQFLQKSFTKDFNLDPRFILFAPNLYDYILNLLIHKILKPDFGFNKNIVLTIKEKINLDNFCEDEKENEISLYRLKYKYCLDLLSICFFLKFDTINRVVIQDPNLRARYNCYDGFTNEEQSKISHLKEWFDYEVHKEEVAFKIYIENEKLFDE
ncbi:hypothetical protein DICPUDRAFT_152984 [Dictyostelium purpureum]|uniref:Uncharacterized protein n=1 Tax=Dictyostelium purpureum TaxID=5786 RepID=F0ZMS3_DICPU|nr:uncharacterized protein DICPUDRAFT_152984 [Dictyostelium purpureum]EGC34762.1 hypothetical protein DICPUDRAFT_152984 [Dictyostelium purpureum]|eukprot:XP_003288724.1 hypothetical protein DICPUDRAFT_152984 [Dictyostelium purpureum]